MAIRKMIQSVNSIFQKICSFGVIFVIVSTFPILCSAQDFSVSPQKLDLQAYRGRATKVDLILKPSIESLVAIEIELKDKNFYIKNKSIIDYIDFSFKKGVTVNGKDIPFSLEIKPSFDALGDYDFDLIFAKSTQGLDDMIRLGYIIPIKLRVLGAPLVESVSVREQKLLDVIVKDKKRNTLKVAALNDGVITTSAEIKTQILVKTDKRYRPIATYEYQISDIKPNQVKISRIFLDNELPKSDLLIKTRVKLSSGAVKTFEEIVKVADKNNLGEADSTKIVLEKPYIEINLQPNASRYFQNKVKNYTNETINLKINIDPESFIVPLKKNIQIAPYQSTNIIGRIVASKSDFSLITNKINIEEEGGANVTFPIIVRNPTKILVKSFKISAPRLEQKKLDNILSFNYEITGQDFMRPDIRIVVRDELLSTMHRITLNELEIGLPGDNFNGKYKILNRITQRPGTYTITFSSDCCEVVSETLKLFVSDDLMLSLE